MARKERSRIWTIFDGLKGDKVVWMIALILILFSAITIFSSTSMAKEVMNGTKTRLDMMKAQLVVIAAGLILITVCYSIKNIKVYRWCARWGYLFSMALIIFVVAKVNLGFIRAADINGAYRLIKVGGFSIYVFEVAKVAMVMYIAWAMDAMKKKELLLPRLVANSKNFKFLAEPVWQKIIYLYIPIGTVVLGAATSNISSAIIIGLVLLVTILIGGLSIKDMLLPAALMLVLAGGIFGVYKISGGTKFTRIETAMNRIRGVGHWEKVYTLSPAGSKERKFAFDQLMQPMAAIEAIREGGPIGKGAGQSTQKYVVPVMFEDYMFSFIAEEYGLLGALIIVILYVSLLARGSLIARNCSDYFGKVAIAGLVILISGQAFMHMFINVGLGPLTGQTLPLVSHGKSAFLVFCIAFGIILSISRISSKKMEQEMKYQNAENPIMERPANDNIQSSLNDLDMLESNELDNDII